MSYKLEKPCTDTQRADFVCEHQGMNYAEDDNAIYFLENWESLNPGGIIAGSAMDSDYIAKITAQENYIKKSQLLSKIEELEKKQFRSAKAKFSGNLTESDLNYYENYEAQINSLREQINIL